MPLVSKTKEGLLITDRGGFGGLLQILLFSQRMYLPRTFEPSPKVRMVGTSSLVKVVAVFFMLLSFQSTDLQASFHNFSTNCIVMLWLYSKGPCRSIVFASGSTVFPSLIYFLAE